MATSDAQLHVPLRVLCRKAPATYQGRPTAFGLQEKKDRTSLLKGKSTGSVLAFDSTARAKEEGGFARFFGPYIHGSGADKHLYVTWHWKDGDLAIISRLKVALVIPWNLVQQSVTQGVVLTTDGTLPEWGVLKDWHGLGIGKVWSLAKP
jgi:hypothetical protein